MANNNTFNGWANYETWNVALYINNDYALYQFATAWAKLQESLCNPIRYVNFVDGLVDMIGPRTADGVDYNDPTLCYTELDEMLEELIA